MGRIHTIPLWSEKSSTRHWNEMKEEKLINEVEEGTRILKSEVENRTWRAK